MQSTLIETKVTPWSWPWRALRTIDKVRHPKEDEKNGQQTSDLIAEGVNPDKSSKHRTAAMKEPVQHSGEVYYGMGPPALESSHSDSASGSGVYNPEKGPQGLPHYQQAAPVKWMHQESIQAPGWSQEAPVPAWGQNFGSYMGGVNVRGQMAFHKGVHEGVALPMGENQLQAPVEVYRDATQAQAQGRGHDWEQHAVAAMHQAQLQAYQHGHKGVELQGQSHVPPHTLQGSMLQPFQATFRPSKQHKKRHNFRCNQNSNKPKTLRPISLLSLVHLRPSLKRVMSKQWSRSRKQKSKPLMHQPYLIRAPKRRPQILQSRQMQRQPPLDARAAFPERDSPHWVPLQQTSGLKPPKSLHCPRMELLAYRL
eukprot:superscaffoldBa00003663_g17437